MKNFKRLFILVLFISGNAALSQSAIDVLHYRATITFDLTNKIIEGVEVVSVRNASAGKLDTIILHVRDVTVSFVSNGMDSLGYAQANGELHVALATPLKANDSINLRVFYEGTPKNEGGSTPWGGFQWGPPTTYTMGVAFHDPDISMTRHWLPSNDIPSDKATFDITYDVPEGYAVAGTGLLQAITHNGGRTQYRWLEDHQTATYLETFAVSKYAVVRNAWNGIPIEIYVAPSDSAHAVSYFSNLPGMLDAYSKAFGPYPFDKVGYCMTKYGCMEHQTMISFALSLLSGTKADHYAYHELAHQWWGDWVTPKDFREAWLSEGLASFGESVYSEAIGGTKGYLDAVRQFVFLYVYEDAANEGIFPLYDFPRASPSSNYPYTIYDKGESVVAMLRYVVGDSAFFTGLRSYGKHNAYGNGTTDIFRQEIEASSGQQLGWFFDQWVFKAGYPTYVSERLLDKPDDPFRLRIRQVQDSMKYPFFRMPLDVAIVKTTGDTIVFKIENHAQYTEEFSFPSILNRDVQSFLVDPLGIILKKNSYSTLGADQIPPTLQGFQLGQNYPNPWNKASQRSTVIPFSLDQAHAVTLELFDALGRNVKTLANGVFSAGAHEVALADTALPSGNYTLRMRVNSSTTVRNLIIAR